MMMMMMMTCPTAAVARLFIKFFSFELSELLMLFSSLFGADLPCLNGH